MKNASGRATVKKTLFTATLLFGVWIVFTSDISLFSLSAGIISSLALGFLGHTTFISDRDTSFKHMLPHPFHLPFYLLRLIVEMYRSSVSVLKAVWKKEDHSRIIAFRTRLKSDMGRLILANSITFTPGTITMDLEEDRYIVHWFMAGTVPDPKAERAVKSKLEDSLEKAIL